MKRNDQLTIDEYGLGDIELCPARHFYFIHFINGTIFRPERAN
jgi:hypothetical protein